jgi:acylphosphatase
MTEENVRHIHAIVHGRVQGVNFRYYTRQTAQQLDITGWVRNRNDGTVEVIAEGNEQALQSLIDFLKTGPAGARVDRLDVEWDESSGQYTSFSVRYTEI